MIRRLPLLAVVLTAVAVATGSLAAQEDHDHVGTPAATPSYADRHDPTAPVRSLTAEEIAQIERGDGAGFALPAELNGVRGPRHVLDLADDLGLTDEQAARVQDVYDRMQAAVIPAGRHYLDALRALEEEFRARTLAAVDLPERVAEVHRLEGELAAAHLDAHLETANILTSTQIAAYQRLRGYE